MKQQIDLKFAGLVVSLGVLAGCSTMPEWTKPSTWVDGVSQAAGPADPAPRQAGATQVATPVAAPAPSSGDVIDPLAEVQPQTRIQNPDAATVFPTVADQPAPRELSTTEAQRREIVDSLVADRDNAKHSAEELRGGVAPAAPPPAPSKTKAPASKDDKPDPGGS